MQGAPEAGGENASACQHVASIPNVVGEEHKQRQERARPKNLQEIGDTPLRSGLVFLFSFLR